MLGVILAGGAGRRIGGDKAAIPLGGKALIIWAINALAPQVTSLAISTNNEALAQYGTPLLPDDEASAGPVAGLVAALGYAQAIAAPGLIVVPCDMPFLPSDLGRQLASRRVGVPVLNDRPLWAVSCWSHRAIDAFEMPRHTARDAAKGFSLRAVLERQEVQLIKAVPQGAFFGVNTMAALKEAEAMAKLRAQQKAQK